MCVCLAVLVQSWLITLETEEAPPVSLAATSQSGSPELVVQREECLGDFHKIQTHSVSHRQTIPTTEDEYVATCFQSYLRLW